MRRILNPIVLATFLACVCLPVWVGAQEAGAPRLSDSADVRIIVDISGSMKTNDPDNLRQPAVRLLARLIPEGADAGVWTFGQYVNMLVPYDAVDDAWRARAIDRSVDINSIALRTNLGEAITVASDDYFTRGDLSNTDFILLTDGKVDVSDGSDANKQERARILGPVLDQLVSKGATFHTVALSAEADSALLETLAERTGGSFNVAASADALNLAFLNALNAAVPQEQVPIEGNGFDVDSGVREFTALIFWGENETSATRELELTDPEGHVSVVGDTGQGMRWARESGYDLITVREPVPGDWQINGELGEGSRVTVVSDLRMVVTPVPTSFSQAQPLELQIAFFEDDDKLTDPDFLGVLDVRVTVTSEDNRSGTKVLSSDQPPANGIYRDTIGALPAAGRYTIEVVADGQTFSRKYSGLSRFDMPEEQSPAVTDDTAQPAGQDSAASRDDGASAETGIDPVVESTGGGPIDLSKVEESIAEAAEKKPAMPAPGTESDSSGWSLWWLVTGGLAATLLAAGGLFVLYRRKSAPAAAGAGDERAGEEVAGENKEIPVVESDVKPSPEPVPEPTDVEKAEVGEDDVPVIEPLSEAEEASPVPDENEDDGVDEFGLEDFDLAEFDDLPDFDEEKKGRLDDDVPDEPEPKK